MGGYDFMKLPKPLKAKHEHEGFTEFRTRLTRRVTWRFVQREVESEQRRQQVVSKLRRRIAHRCGHRLRRHQFEERLLRVQTRRNEGARMDLFTVSQFNTRCPAFPCKDT